MKWQALMATAEELLKVLAPVVDSFGIDLDDVSLSKAGSKRILSISLDRDGGVDLDAVAEVSRGISELLDATDIMGATPYVLEVSSRGVDKPLTKPVHWHRNVGRLVKVVGSSIHVTGRVVSSTDNSVVLNIKGQMRTIAFDDVAKAHVQVEFNRSEVDEA